MFRYSKLFRKYNEMKKKQVMTLIGLSMIFFSFIAIQGELFSSPNDADLSKNTGAAPVIPDMLIEDDDTHKNTPALPIIPDLEPTEDN